MSDGSRLRQSWYDALNDAETHFRRLLTSSSSPEWKRVVISSDSSSTRKGKARVAVIPELADVIVHRNSSKSGDDVYRLVLDVPTGEEPVSLEPWKAVLATPELRQEWDPAVEEAHLVEVFDHTTRICKTNFTLGWPANPRDAVTISRSFHDASTIIDISTSLPRSPDEPAYLRPSPPYVRSHVSLFAWCIQYVQPPLQPTPQVGEEPKRKNSLGGRLRITCLWQHDLRTVWNIGSSSGVPQQLSTMTLGLLKTVMKRGSRVPKFTGYGNDVTIERIRFQIDRQALTIDYAIIPEDEEHGTPSERMQGMDELQALREQRRLTRSIECVLPSSEGWDVQVSTKASSQEVEELPWSAHATRSSSYPSSGQSASSPGLDQIVLRLSHASLIDDHSILKVRVVIELSGPSSGLRLNGLPETIQHIEERDPSSNFISDPILQDMSSTADLSFHTVSSIGTVNSTASTSSSAPTLVRPHTERTAAAEKSILSRVRRSYIYFSSLLQEPEAKWRRTTEARGVSITQLDSIDPTLVVYRAEATFVGVGLWDLYGAVVSPGAKIYWDKQHEDAVLLEDVNELTELWHFKTRPAWPVNGRDSVVLKTVYKSPTTIHVFSFSAEDPHLFPNVPPAEPNVIRTQVDLQGWAIEALSPTTTLLTLLEQSDPKGWTNKTSIPTQMMNALAGIGEFAIKCGGPPVVTRLAGAKANEIRYDHERSSFRIEYENSASRRACSKNSDHGANGIGSPMLPVIECEIRCDVDTWASSLDIVVDPPPQSISCLRRHRLSAEGGGLWLTMTHDAVFVDDERLLAIVRRGPGKEKGLVMVNGAKVNVDVEELPDHEIKSLTKRKRVKPPRIPLDQPPVVGVIRRRRAEWDADTEGATISDGNSMGNNTSGWASAPRISSPLARFFTFAVDQATSTTQQAVAAISPATAAVDDAVLSSSKLPMQYALEALAWIQESHSRFTSEDWVVVSDKGISVSRKLAPEISPGIPVHRGEKVIEGVSAEELGSVITEYDCRKKWDDRFDSAYLLESFGAECRTSFVVSKSGFPFRDRGFYLASVMARAHVPPPLPRRSTGDVAEQSNGTRNAIFCVSASFNSESIPLFSPAKYNAYGLPIGRVFVDGWILETLDPYTKENYAIPSTRCTRIVTVDYAGSIPAVVNSMINASLPRSILAVEAYVKSISSLPITRLPAPGLVTVDKKIDEPFASISWKLRRRDENRILLNTKYTPDECVYRSTLLLTIPSPVTTSPTRGPDQITPRPSKLVVSLSPPPPLPEPPEMQPIGSASSGSDISFTPTLTGLPATLTTPTAYSGLRQRTVSNSSSSPDASLRGRSSSSAFTIKGEVRPSTDLVVTEIVIDSKLYPDGYSVLLSSRMRGTGTKPQHIPLHSPADTNQILPFACTIHTMPSSPLHSSGLNAESPTRHLLRLLLPTAQYQISTVRDPLTGETQSAPPKPGWYLKLQEGGAVIDVEIRPNEKNNGKKSEKGLPLVVTIDGTEVVVVNEKESLTSLGREELLDDRVSKMAILSRISNEAEPLPHELMVPVAVADDLFDPVVVSSFAIDGPESKEAEETSTSSESSEETSGARQPETPLTPHTPHVASSGLLGFLHSYPNPLTRFSTTTTTRISVNPTASPSLSTSSSRKFPGGLTDIDDASTTHHQSIPLCPLSTTIIIALIAFLIGSLLRSLLSPADFIYVVTDLREAEEANTLNGWREIRRLFEIKYIFGGWDFQIAVVRRH